MIYGLLGAVVLSVVCSVYAPSLQSSAIDRLSEGAFDKLPRILVMLIIVYGIYGLGTLFQSLLSAHLNQRIVKKMREDLFDKIVNLPIRYLDKHPHGIL